MPAGRPSAARRGRLSDDVRRPRWRLSAFEGSQPELQLVDPVPEDLQLGLAGQPPLPWPRKRPGACSTTTSAPSTTPAGDTILGEAARLAGSQPVGSHHLLLAALADPDTAAARALVSLGVDLDQAKATLRGADITGTSDEPPEEAGPPPDGHPGDRRPAHHRGNRPSDH